MFFEFRWITPISLKLPEIFPQFIQNPSSFPEYFLKIFTLKICLNCVKVLRMYKECTQNFLQIFQKFPNSSQNFVKTFRIPNLFFLYSFFLIFRIFLNNPAEIFKVSFKLYSQNFYKYLIMLKISQTVRKFIQYF